MIGGHLGNRVSDLVDGQLERDEEDRAWQHVHACHYCRDLVEREGWVKTRLARDRFASGANLRVVARDPADVFSEAEMARIAAFNAAMGLDWGTLDILRDVDDGRIYVVDVNKTDVGPVLQLSMRDKLRSTRTIARALRALIATA